MRFSLWPACVRSHSFVEQLAAAARSGFTHLPIGLVTYRSLGVDGLNDQDILDLAAEHGVKLGHYDGFSAWAPLRFNDDLPAEAKAVFDVSSEECLEICQRLGLDSICATGTFNPGQFANQQLSDCFARFCEQAQTFGIQVDLEFLPMWGIPSLEAAWEIYSPHRPDNAGILLDTWHFYRGKPDLQLLASLPPGTIKTVQLADAETSLRGDNLFEDCLLYRRLPGAGELDLDSVLEILGNIGGITNIGPEIFSLQLDQLSADDVAHQCRTACRRVLEPTGLLPQRENDS